jgi:hypothetical protein
MLGDRARWPEALRALVNADIILARMWLKHNKPPIWEWFIPPIFGDLGEVQVHLLLLTGHFCDGQVQ